MHVGGSLPCVPDHADIESPISHSPTLNQLDVDNRTHIVKLRVLGLCKFDYIVPVMISRCKVNDKWDSLINRTFKIVAPDMYMFFYPEPI